MCLTLSQALEDAAPNKTEVPNFMGLYSPRKYPERTAERMSAKEEEEGDL